MRDRSALPTGTVTFLFTDIEGSTKLWENDRPAMRADLARHDALMRAAVESRGGYVFKTMGDAFCVVFDVAADAVAAALAAQLSLGAEAWRIPDGVRARMALHTGSAEERDGDYFGPTLNRAARLLAVGHGGQILLSLVTAELTRDELPEGAALSDLGEHRLRDLLRPETVFQLSHQALPGDFPPLKSLDNRAHNLPLQPTPFIGRARELAEIERLLAEESVRVLSLTGVGGAGKTRLGLQVAADVLDAFADGAWFVDLCAIDTPEHAIPAIARALGIRESSGRPIEGALKEFARTKQLLLLLDNYEQITGDPAPLVDLLASCPRVKFLVTSREALHLRGETVFAVPTLSQPRIRRGQTIPLPRLRQYESVTLFIERALAIRQGFAVTNANAPAIAEICVRLDGLPLAIELAAARIATLSPEDILERLDSRLKLLSGGLADLPQRQRTLRATIDWSYRLLGPEEKILFREASVFSGGCTLRAVEKVCACAREGGIDAVEVLSSLAGKSLLCMDESRGEPRFRMLESIREYGLELLAKDGLERDIRDAHARYFLDLALETEPRLKGSKQKAAFGRLEADNDNLKAALEWFFANGRPEEGLRLCGALSLFWKVHGYLSEGLAALSRGLAMVKDVPPRVRAKSLLWAGSLAMEIGDYEGSTARLAEAQRLYGETADNEGLAECRNEQGWTAYRQGRLDEARARFASLRGEKLTEDPVLLATAGMGLGMILRKENRLEEAEALLQESRRVFASHGDSRELSRAINNLSGVYERKADYKAAIACCGEAVRIREQIGDVGTIALAYNNLAFYHTQLGDAAEARACYERVAGLSRMTGNMRLLCYAFAGLAESFAATGEREKALAFALKARSIAETQEPGLELGVSLRVLADIELSLGRAGDAKGHFEASIPLLEKSRELNDLERARKGYALALSRLSDGGKGPAS